MSITTRPPHDPRTEPLDPGVGWGPVVGPARRIAPQVAMPVPPAETRGDAFVRLLALGAVTTLGLALTGTVVLAFLFGVARTAR